MILLFIGVYSIITTPESPRLKQTQEIVDWINTCPKNVVLTEHFAIRNKDGTKDATAAYIVCDFSAKKKETTL